MKVDFLKVRVIIDNEILQRLKDGDVYRIAGWIEVINKYCGDVRIPGRIPKVEFCTSIAIIQFNTDEDTLNIIEDYLNNQYNGYFCNEFSYAIDTVST